ncbi:nicotinamide riboside transporter PnuC [Pseudocolwellia sp. HL-MZ7]|uniref:nicotinamide riboside transporter PnuC n=1 Tax=Pseudocolwellia sp. HL-MZ7 TaxID=3400627 RepID=UPI003CFA4C51
MAGIVGIKIPKRLMKKKVKLKAYKLKTHVIMITGLSVTSFVVGILMDKYTPTDFPYLDSTTTVFAVFATYLVAQKVVENWLYWIVIDAVSIYLYVEKDLMPTAFLFTVFIVIAVYGYYKWRQEYKGYNDLNASLIS